MLAFLFQLNLATEGVPIANVPTFNAPSLISWFIFSGIVVVVLAVSATILILKAKARHRHQVKIAFDKTVLLITVPKEAQEKGDAGKQEKTLQQIQEDIGAMEAIFSAIGGLTAERGAKSLILGREDWFSFEIVASESLISFYVVAPLTHKEFIEQQIQAQVPHAQIEDVPDYNFFSPDGVYAGASFKLKRESMFPLKTYKLAETDPLNSLTNSLSKIEPEDGAAIQILVRSAKRGWRTRAEHVTKQLSEGKSFYEATRARFAGKSMGEMMKSKERTEAQHEKDRNRKVSKKEEEMVERIQQKSGSLGLDVNIRVVVGAQSQPRATAYLNNITAAFSQFNIPQFGNSLVITSRKGKKLLNQFVFRFFDEKSSMVLVGEELASIFHLPLPSTETPNIRWLSARKAPPPPNIPQEGLHIGSVTYRGETTQVHIKREDRFRHLYLIGKSGSGKSEYIANMAVQDIRNGDGVCVVDPHGDLIETILPNIPKERADDVIIFDPSDMERPIGLNMLEAPNEEMKDFVVGEMIAIFYKLFPPDMIGPMFEHHMRNYMLTLMSDVDNPGTLAEIPRLISDDVYQKQWVAKVKDPVVRSYWENEMANVSDHQKNEMLGYLISKIGRFVENTMMRNIIGQQKSSFDFSDIMNNKKIFLVNLSKGKIGDLNANLLGLIVVTKLQMAAMSRAGVEASERPDFFLYIDEFQNFITPSIATILSEARKYRLSLIIAHQYLGQLSPKGDHEIRDAVLGNVGSMLIGRIGVEDAEMLEKEFAPVFTTHDLVNVEKFSWNSKILIDNEASRPFNIQSQVPVQGNKKIGDAIKQLSRLKYGKDRGVVERDILSRAKYDSRAPKPPAKPPA